MTDIYSVFVRDVLRPLRRQIIVILVFCFAPFFLFIKPIFFDQSFITYHALSGYLPIKYQIVESIKNLTYPVWNGFLSGGLPFHTGIGVWDPFLITHFFTDNLYLAFLGSVWLALVVAGVGMYALLRRVFDRDVGTSLVCGLFYMACPFFQATVHETSYLNPAVWLPYIFLCSNPLLSGFFLGLTMLSGNVESYFFVTIFYIIVQIMLRRSWYHSVLFGFAFALIDLIPTIINFKLSNREPFYLYQYAYHFVFMALAALGLTMIKSKWFHHIFIGCVVLLFIIGWEGHHIFDYSARERFIFYFQPPMYLFTGFSLLCFVMGLFRKTLDLDEDRRLGLVVIQPDYVRMLGYFAIMLVLFPYTLVPNLNHYLGLDLIAYPRIMFAFFFLQTVVIAHSFSTRFYFGQTVFYGLFMIEIFFLWNIHVFQNNDHHAITRYFPETDFFSEIKNSETVEIRNDDRINLRNFYEKDQPLNLGGNMPLLWNVRSVHAQTINIKPKWMQPQKPDYIYSDVAVKDIGYEKVLNGERYIIYARTR